MDTDKEKKKFYQRIKVSIQGKKILQNNIMS